MLQLLVNAFIILSTTVSIHALAPSGVWDTFNLAPSSRTVYPVGVKKVNGNVKGTIENNGFMTLEPESWVTFDFGKEIGGWVSFSFSPPSSNLRLAFTESPQFIGPISDDSSYPSANMSYDGALNVVVPNNSNGGDEGWTDWTMPREKLRGGFRYLTVVGGSTKTLVSNISVSIEFMPHWEGVRDLREYSGYFYTSETELLNKAWYAGAYTVQTNTVPINTGRQVPFVNSALGWLNNATLTFNVSSDPAITPIIVDGAKRDRAVWPGDMGIAVPTQFVSTFDLTPTRNALSTMFESLNPKTGALDESGPPLSQTGSDTYHMHTLIGTYNYWLYSGDDEWVNTIWTNYTKAVSYLAGRVDQTGLLDVLGLRDWARLGQGGHNSEANALYYRVLTTASILAQIPSLPSPSLNLATEWSKNATLLKGVYNTLLWDDTAGMYKDNTTNTTLHPQDGNSFAVLYNLTLNDTQATRISAGLTKNWNNIGAVAPELPGTISPFISGFEVQAHFTAGNDDRALDLINRTWGYMVNTPLSVQSTLLEGFTSNGSIWYRAADGYNFDPSYTSHSHGWSSGATSALTFYVLGLQVVQSQGSVWKVEPHPGSNLNNAEGGFETNLGWFGVQWNIDRSGKSGKKLTISIDVPSTSTRGSVVLPPSFRGKVVVDGKQAENWDVELDGGKHVIVGYAN
ncbi:hypothetical protein Clacol_003940 [Clathrus columnatus]|uniref:Glycoside hydrolase family 78 protein n=1 Tax=Clathrus columnatus TaxID=1419009 RepID=A0AAV5A9P2_9AGAM|nr:hypothetical protein Clacol_003940 [Clathrus columnatus]